MVGSVAHPTLTKVERTTEVRGGKDQDVGAG
jgi:hypothetical protein